MTTDCFRSSRLLFWRPLVAFITADSGRLQAATTGVPTAGQERQAIPKKQPVQSLPLLSAMPTDAEISRARVFGEPLVPVGERTSGRLPGSWNGVLQ
jgi:hypothetical protein